MGNLFGTDGVRGIANVELTPELAFKLGRAAAYIIRNNKGSKPVFAIGTDTRISKDMLLCSLSAGICSVGGKSIQLGVLPTPGVAYLARTSDVDAGVMISASHNSFEYNGIKFFNNRGFKLSDEYEDMIESHILADRDNMPDFAHSDIGTVEKNEDFTRSYEEYLCRTIENDIAGMKIILDCANGAASNIAPQVLRNLGVEVISLFDSPDGININMGCGSTNIDKLQQRVKGETFDCAIALDGDADRLMMLDEKGKPIDGDQIMTMIALQLKREGRLVRNTLVATVMSNMGLDIMAKKNGIDLVKTKVGDRYVLEEMLKNGYALGGEQSGHIIFLEKNTTGDGIISALQVLRIMKLTGKKLSELVNDIEILPQVLMNARVSNIKKAAYNDDEIICTHCIELENELEGNGRILIRPSGTEPLVRVMIEGRDIGFITERAKKLVRIIEERMN